MNKRKLKVVRLYGISILCIFLYFFLENSNLIAELVSKSERGRYGSFPTFFLTGIFKYGLLVVGFGIFVILSFFIIKERLVQNSDGKRNEKNNEKAKNRKLKLLVSYDYGQVEKTISENVTVEIIKETMNSINWNEFHIVQLEDKNADGYKVLDVGGSLGYDGLASGLMTDDDHILLAKPLETVDQMTEILLDFLKGEDFWLNKYEYK